jgi:WD40 repeat protein
MAETPNFDKAALAWTLPWDADWVTATTFVGATRRVAAGNNLGQILLWDLPEKAGEPAPFPCRRLDGHTNVISRLVATPDGRYLISASYDHTIRVWDMQAEAKGTEEIVLNARTRMEAEARKNNGAKVPPPIPAKVDVQQADKVLDAHKDWVLGLTMSADGNLLVSGDDRGEIIVWDRPALKEVRRWKVKGWVYALAISPDGTNLLASERIPLVFDSGRYGATKLWDPATGQMRHDLGKTLKQQSQEHMGAAAFSPDNKLVALIRGGEANGPSGKPTLFDAASGDKVREMAPGHVDGGTDLAFHPDGKHLASAGRDTLIRIWNRDDGKLVKELGKARGGQFKDWIHSIAFTADGQWLAAADMAGHVLIYAM